jgi:light-regulated signal transduction histidine kinase (bacteriophytochrome)
MNGGSVNEITTLPGQEIEHLKAENLASKIENADLREAARADQIAIGTLKASNDSLEAMVAELKCAQNQIELLSRGRQARNTALEAVNKELESFSYAVSHDLRSPLRSIHGFSEALRRSAEPKLSPEEISWLQKISDAAARMDRLTEDLLRLSRITRSQLKREPVDLTLLAREVVHELRQTDPQRDVVFAISDGLRIQGDPVLMRVALTNLLANAWKYTSRRESALISFGSEQRDGRTIFCVRDNGAGFDMLYASKLFAPFQRLHSTREFPGSGVGLACVARVIHKHGGRIWADARTGEGAAFFFTVPEQAGPDGNDEL